MLKKTYIAIAAFLVGGYATWSLLGYELGGTTRDPVPTARAYSSSSGSSGYRSRTGWFGGGGGWSFGK